MRARLTASSGCADMRGGLHYALGVLMGARVGVRDRREPIASEKLDVTDDGYGRNLCNERRLCTVSCNGRRLWQVSIAINVIGYMGLERFVTTGASYMGRAARLPQSPSTTVSCNGRRLWQVSIAINVIGYMGLERFVTTGASYMGRAARLPQSPSTSIGLERLAINVVGYIGRRWIAINGASCMGCTARLPQSPSTNIGRRRLAKLPLAALVLAICHNRRRLHGVAPPDDEDAVAEMPQSPSTNIGRRRLAKLPLAALVLAICHNRRRLHGVAPPDDEDAVAERGVRCGDLMAAAVLDARLVNVR